MSNHDPELVAMEAREAAELRACIIAHSEAHERDHHAGEPCPEHRVGLVAFFAHSLGLKIGHLPGVAVALLEYEAQHRHHDNRNGDA